MMKLSIVRNNFKENIYKRVTEKMAKVFKMIRFSQYFLGNQRDDLDPLKLFCLLYNHILEIERAYKAFYISDDIWQPNAIIKYNPEKDHIEIDILLSEPSQSVYTKYTNKPSEDILNIIKTAKSVNDIISYYKELENTKDEDESNN